MEKKALLNALKEMLRFEETATSIYLQHLRAISDRFSKNKKIMEEVRKVFNSLIEANKSHHIKCKTFIEEISKVGSYDI